MPASLRKRSITRRNRGFRAIDPRFCARLLAYTPAAEIRVAPELRYNARHYGETFSEEKYSAKSRAERKEKAVCRTGEAA
jgi:hypothetical protein